MNRDYNDPVYKRWRAAVRKRDGNRCQMPGCCKRKRLQAHHILSWANYPLLRYEVSNGITICYDHHKEVTGHEHVYITLFTEIVNGKPKRVHRRKRQS